MLHIKDRFSKKTKKDRYITVILLICIFVTVGFIFSNSLKDTAASKAQSTQAKEIVEPVLTPIIGEENVTDRLVRKLAHLTEFGLLGFELALLVRKWFLPSFLMTLGIAAADEVVQIFSHRGPLFTDVLLDFFGACLGFAAGIGFVALIRIGMKAYERRKITV